MQLPQQRLVPRLNRGTLVVTVLLVLVGLLFVISAQTARGTQLRADRSDLPGLIRAEDARVAARLHRVQKLRAEIERQTSGASLGNQDLTDLRRRIDELDEAGGLAPVKGPALVVTLQDAPRGESIPEGASPDDLVVHQQDVQAVVNTLWQGGAEAMMLQDQRVISTSAFRCVGNTMILQGRVYSPPYVITAVGDVAQMRAALDASPAVDLYQHYVDLFGLGWQVQEQPEVVLPAFSGLLELSHARARGPGSDAGSDAGSGSGGTTSPAGEGP